MIIYDYESIEKETNEKSITEQIEGNPIFVVAKIAKEAVADWDEAYISMDVEVNNSESGWEVGDEMTHF